MAKKHRRRKSRPDETLSRNVIISSISTSVRITMEDATDPDPLLDGRQYLDLRGYMPDPVRDIDEVVMHLWSDAHWRVGSVRPAAIAHVVGMRPAVDVICSLPPAEFGYVWSLALSGRLTHAYLTFTRPHYNRAPVHSLSFSSELEE